MIITILMVLLAFIWVLYESNWGLEIVIVETPNQSPVKYIYNVIQGELNSRELPTFITDDIKETLLMARDTLMDVENELGRRTIAFGADFAKSGNHKWGTKQRPYKFYTTRQLDIEYQALDWFSRALEEAIV